MLLMGKMTVLDKQGTYQYHALKSKNKIKQFWHSNKLNVVDFICTFNKKDTVLDFGCGSGNLIFHLDGRVKSLTGIDVSDESLRFCNTRKKQSHHPETTKLFQKYTGSTFQLGKERYDKIFSLDVIEHIPDKELIFILKQLEVALKQNGKIVVFTPHKNSLWPILEWTANMLEISPEMTYPHLHTYIPQDLKKLFLKHTGLKIEKVFTFYTLSPFVALFSDRLAEQQLKNELRTARIGMMLGILLTKE